MRTPPNERLTPDIAEASRPRKAEPEERCPERRCILAGETSPREGLIRLAVSPGRAAVIRRFREQPPRCG